MSRASLTRILLYTACFSWPLRVYEVLPGAGIAWSTVVSLAVVSHATTQLPRAGKLRVPLELLWPVLAAIALAGWSQPGVLPETLLAGLAFWAILHLYGSDTTWRQAGLMLACGSACAVLVDLFHDTLGVPPTVLVPGSTVELVCTYGVADACVGLVTGLGLSGSVALDRHAPRLDRGLAGGMTLLLLAGLANMTWRLWPLAATWAPTPWVVESPVLALLRLVIAWLLVRAAAKGFVRATMERGLMRLAPPAALFTLAVIWCVAEVPVAVGHVFPLALLVRGTMRRDRDAIRNCLQDRIAWGAIMVLLLAVVTFNARYVLPSHANDPRNYAARAEAAAARGALSEMEDQLSAVYRRHPGEARAALWLGRAALEAGYLDRASMWVGAMVHHGENTLLPPPRRAEVEQFLGELRDAISLSDETPGLAYERALLFAGEEENALALLRLRRPAVWGEPLAAEPMAQVVSTLLLAPSEELRAQIAALPPRQLAGILTAVGADVRRVPERFPRRLLPAFIWTQKESAVANLWVHAGGIETNRRFPMKDSSNVSGWTPLEPEEGETWCLSQTGPPDYAIRFGDGFDMEILPEEDRRGAHEAVQPPGPYGIVVLLP